MSHHKTTERPHRAFELERLILFSDAVFAIAITLLVIEVKFPELPKEGLAQAAYEAGLHHFYAQLLAFVVSFFFVGNFWIRHLRFCRVLQHYNENLIKLNLLFLFFIVTFPFCATMLSEHVSEAPLLALSVYVGNICCCSLSFMLLMRYPLKVNRDLTYRDMLGMQEHIYKEVRFTTISFMVMVTAAVTVAYYTHDFKATMASVLIFPLLGRIRAYRIKAKARAASRHVRPEVAVEEEHAEAPASSPEEPNTHS